MTAADRYLGGSVDCLGIPTGGWLSGRGGGGCESKQSLVNFPEGRPRAWLGRGQSKAAFEPIKRQEARHLQWGENATAEQKGEETSERTPGEEDADLPQPLGSASHNKHTHILSYFYLCEDFHQCHILHNPVS